jgi:hypothetical protein
MTKADFIFIAHAIAHTRMDQNERNKLVTSLCGYFQTRNLRFDRSRFTDAAQLLADAVK